MKRIVVCMDGTWQSLHQPQITNVAIIARSVAHTGIDRSTGKAVEQIVLYSQGVGCSTGALRKREFFSGLSAAINRLSGGAFGEGLEDGILDTYLRLVFLYEAGDEIFIFGFSRGAFAARRLAGLINAAGIVSREHADKAWAAYRLYHEAPRVTDATDLTDATAAALVEYEEEKKQFRKLFGKRDPRGALSVSHDVPPITYLGVFDTVVQRGLGGTFGSIIPWIDKRYRFNNLRICPNVQAARHAVALDECRIAFPSTQWIDLEASNAAARELGRHRDDHDLYQQSWFVGTHGDVGGGAKPGLSPLALEWIVDGAQQQGLEFYGLEGGEDDLSPLGKELRIADLTAPISWPGWRLMTILGRQRRVWEGRGRPREDDVNAVKRKMHKTVIDRIKSDALAPPYRPAPLHPFRGLLWAQLTLWQHVKQVFRGR